MDLDFGLTCSESGIVEADVFLSDFLEKFGLFFADDINGTFGFDEVEARDLIYLQRIIML